MLGSRLIRSHLLFIAGVLLLSGALHGLPIKPKLEDIIKDAKKPQVNYPPARAGWNGPEEKSAVPAPNATYDRLRKSMSPEAARMQLLEAAKPDWRALLGVAVFIFSWRYKRVHTNQPQEKPRQAEVAIPSSVSIPNQPTAPNKRAA